MDPMAEIRASFFIECEELLESLQDGLQGIQDGDDDSETINVVFRAVHSIKGGAGAFGLEALVRFAHRFETALDLVRNGSMVADDAAQRLFFSSADHLSDLVRVSRDGEPLPEARSAELLGELDELIGDEAEEEEEEEIDFQPAGLSLDLGGMGLDLPDLGGGDEAEAEVDADGFDFLITFKPHSELYDTGNEPFHLLRALNDLGECEVTCNTGDIPLLAEHDAERPYVSWEIRVKTDAEAAEISSIFEFVDGLCDLDVKPLKSAPAPAPAFDELDDLPPPPPTMDDEPQDMPPPPPPPAAETAPSAPSKPPAASGEAKGGRKEATTAKSVVRVDLDRIERLVNLVGELVINQAMLSQSLENSGLSMHSDAMNGLEEFQRLTRDIQDSVMMIRAQPVKSLFQRMSRIVREASATIGKDVKLITEGETTEVDKTVIERLADPLTHMIRNAVDHGLESSEKREAAGKPRQGEVRLTAAHKSGRVVIDVSDDGGGINREKVFEIAVSKGLVPADANLSETEIDNLLFLPGFSTASEISDLSGRGVGMDVVKTSIQALGGRITITSEAGKGTTFSISLPLTLAVLDGMVVEVAGETLVIPLNMVVETLTLNELTIDRIRPGLVAARVRGEFVPLHDLGVALGYRQPMDDITDAVILLIAREDGERSALMIDAIRDQRQVVIKGLDENLHKAPGIAAATILGDGQIALILDPTDILSASEQSNTQPMQDVSASAGVSA